jgi:hypothetical protein
MKHFISFQKRKGLYLELPSSDNNNEALAHQINHELMKYGYVVTKDLFDRLSVQSEETLTEVYNDLMKGIQKVLGDGSKFEPIYRNFPQSVLAMSYLEFAVNAILHYWSFGNWRPEDAGYLEREFKLEPVKYKNISLLSKSQFDSIFTDILSSTTSISKFDKQIIDDFIHEGVKFNFSDIKFKETAAYVGKRLLNDESINVLPTRDAVSVLRIYSAFSGGDEGLKENTKFKKPTRRHVKVLSATLDASYNLEEAFKVYREKFLRLLFYLNPLTKDNAKRYPNLFKYANLLRNKPKELRTFNSRVEELLGKNDASVLELLKKRPGAFTRRLDHCVRVFGIKAINVWLDGNESLSSLATAYNHFTDRDKEQEGRGAILASASKSNVVTYDSLVPLDANLVNEIKTLILDRVRSMKRDDLKNKKVFIDRALYYRPLGMNNRASSLSLDGKVKGTVEVIPEGKTIRMYVHWHGRHDIDLSALVLGSDNNFVKVGWNGSHHMGSAIVYSGDNTGHSSQNAEYLDIEVGKLPKNTEWVITEARIFRGPSSYSKFKPKTKVGWMLRKYPEANSHWLPETVEHAMVLENEGETAYLQALHIPTRSLVFLDMAMGSAMVSNKSDAIKMRSFLKTFVTLDSGDSSIKWDKINQGHILNAISGEVVESVEEADLVFDENTTLESVSSYL